MQRNTYLVTYLYKRDEMPRTRLFCVVVVVVVLVVVVLVVFERRKTRAACRCRPVRGSPIRSTTAIFPDVVETEVTIR